MHSSPSQIPRSTPWPRPSLWPWPCTSHNISVTGTLCQCWLFCVSMVFVIFFFISTSSSSPSSSASFRYSTMGEIDLNLSGWIFLDNASPWLPLLVLLLPGLSSMLSSVDDSLATWFSFPCCPGKSSGNTNTPCDLNVFLGTAGRLLTRWLLWLPYISFEPLGWSGRFVNEVSICLWET